MFQYFKGVYCCSELVASPSLCVMYTDKTRFVGRDYTSVALKEIL